MDLQPTVAQEIKPLLYLRKYPNRRLYSLSHKKYVTFEDVLQFLRDGHDLVIYQREKNKKGFNEDKEDVTADVLLGVIQDNPRLTEALSASVDFKAFIRTHV